MWNHVDVEVEKRVYGVHWFREANVVHWKSRKKGMLNYDDIFFYCCYCDKVHILTI